MKGRVQNDIKDKFIDKKSGRKAERKDTEKAALKYN